MRKTTRKILATLLAFAMLFGSSLTVFAKEYNWNELQEGTILKNGDIISVTYETLLGCGLERAYYIRLFFDIGWAPVDDDTNFGRDSKLSYTVNNIEANKVFKVSRTRAEAPNPSGADFFVEGERITDSTPQTPSTNPTPSSNPVEEPTKIEEPSKIEEVHEHSYSWETVQEATTEQDGIEEYRCSCGDVKERSVIPASQALVSGLFDIVKNAPLNGVAQYDSGRLYTMSDYIIKKLAERSDVTTVVTFEYERKPYKMTIPAGVDYAAILADDDYFYGYFYFAKITGSTIEEIN